MRKLITLLAILVCGIANSQPQVAHTFETQVGVLVQNAGATTSDKADIIRNTLHSRYVRFTAISMQDYTGSSPALTVYKSYGLVPHLVIDVGYGGTNPDGWITNTTSYNLTMLATDFEDILTDNSDIPVVVLDNEELNQNAGYHIPYRVKEYLAIAAVIQSICHKHGVLLSNGGFGNFYAVNGYVARWMKGKYGTTAATNFCNLTMTTGQKNNALQITLDTSLEHWIASVDSVVQSPYFDILNFHAYHTVATQRPNPDTAVYVWQNEICRYYKECYTNANPNKRRLVAWNETGQRFNSGAPQVQNILDMAWRLGFLFFDYWSGNGITLNATPLTNDDGSIKSNGIIYADWQDAHYLPIGLP